MGLNLLEFQAFLLCKYIIIRKLRKILLAILAVLVVLVVSVFMLLQISAIQTWIAAKASQLIWEKAHVDVRVGRVGISRFSKAALEDVYIADLNGDTLIYAAEVNVSLLGISLDENAYRLRNAALRRAYVNLNVDTMVNISALIKTIFPPDTTVGKPFEFSIGRVELRDTRFRFGRSNPKAVERGVNYDDMRVNHINLDADDLIVKRDTVKLGIRSLSFVEQSGFVVDNLQADFSICSSQMRFGNLRIVHGYNDLSLGEFAMNYESYEAMSDFLNNVELYGDFHQSRVNLAYIGYFAPVLLDFDVPLTIDGLVRGPVSDLHGRNLRISYGDKTLVSTNISMTGLPDIDQTLFNARFKELSTTLTDIAQLRRANGEALIKVPTLLHSLGSLRYKGDYIGYLRDFVAYGTLSSGIGSFMLDASIQPDRGGGYRYKGRLDAHEVNLGALVKKDMLGHTTFSAMVDGTSDSKGNIDLDTRAQIDVLEANGYRFADIGLNGALTNRTYAGHIELNDPNCQLNFEGTIDFSGDLPIFDFSAQMPALNLVALNLNKVDTLSEAAFGLTAHLVGSNLDNSQGMVTLDNVVYRNQRGEFAIDNVSFEAHRDYRNMHRLTLRSDAIDAELQSQSLVDLWPQLVSVVGRYLPAMAHAYPLKNDVAAANHELQLYLKHTSQITSVLLPQLHLADRTLLSGRISPDSLLFNLDVPAVRYGSCVMQRFAVHGFGSDSLLNVAMQTSQLQVGELPVRNVAVDLLAQHDTVSVGLDWNNRTEERNEGKIFACADFRQFGREGHWAHVDLKPSQFFLNDSVWFVRGAGVSLDTGGIGLHNLFIDSHSQSLQADGRVSHDPADTLRLDLHNLNLVALNVYLAPKGYKLAGSITGAASANGLYDRPSLLADLRLDGLELNNQPLGSVRLGSRWFNDERRMGIELSSVYEGDTRLKASGSVWADGMLDLRADIGHVDLRHIGPLVSGVLSDLSGYISGTLHATGSLKSPCLNGELGLHSASLVVDVLGTRYTTSGTIPLVDSDFQFNDLVIKDIHNHNAMLNGRIATGRFSGLDIGLSLTPSNFQCMNTTERDNPSFYASAYATGVVIVNGDARRLNFDIYARTEPNTNINLPLNSRKNVDDSGFITFVTHKDRAIADSVLLPILSPEHKPSMEINLNMEFEVTPDATAQLIIDKKMGDIIRANGRGNIKVELNPSRDVLRLLGHYEIERGDYMFTLRNVLSKKFSIERGGSIVWSGDPVDALVDITAAYRLKASLRPLLGEEYTSRVPVDCQINLSQKLLSPQIGFGVSLPNATAEERDVLAIALNTQEKVNTQFLSLLALNTFIADDNVNVAADDGGGGGGGNNNNLSTAGFNTVSELLFNQLSNQFSGLFNDKFTLGMNYRRGAEEELTKDQVEVAVSAQVFGDRLTFNGSAFNNNSLNSTAAPIAGNINAEWKINKSGKLKAKVFARYNDDFLNTLTTTENEYITGAGLSYSEEFNNFRDLLYRLRHMFSSDPAPAAYHRSGRDEENESDKVQDDNSKTVDELSNGN